MRKTRHAPSVGETLVHRQNSRRERIALRIIYTVIGLLVLAMLLAIGVFCKS